MVSTLDIIIAIIILITGVLGFKRGVFKELILFVGTIVVFIIAYKLKNLIGDFMVLNFPFIEFSGHFKGAMALNIIVYQSIAFIVVALVLFALYDLLLSATGIFEKILKATIILGIPSKILGFLLGLIEGYVIAFIIAFFVSQPALDLQWAKDSQVSDFMLNHTPILTSITKDTLAVAEKINGLSDIDNTNELNLELVDIILKNDITSVDVVEKLVNKGKLNVKNIDTVINKYK